MGPREREGHYPSIVTIWISHMNYEQLEMFIWALWYLRDFKFEIFCQHFGIIIKKFLHIITWYVWDKRQYMLNGIVKYS